jgi:hypothetical protein
MQTKDEMPAQSHKLQIIYIIYIFSGVMLEVNLLSLLCPSKNEIAFKITIGRVINYY